jgi:hypothetical protein
MTGVDGRAAIVAGVIWTNSARLAVASLAILITLIIKPGSGGLPPTHSDNKNGGVKKGVAHPGSPVGTQNPGSPDFFRFWALTLFACPDTDNDCLCVVRILWGRRLSRSRSPGRLSVKCYSRYPEGSWRPWNREVVEIVASSGRVTHRWKGLLLIRSGTPK